MFTIFDIMTEINSHSGNLWNNRQTKHEKKTPKNSFLQYLTYWLNSKFHIRQFVKQRALIFSHLAKWLEILGIWPNDWRSEAFDQMTGGQRHLTKWLVWHIDCNTHIYIYVWKLNKTVLELDFRAVKFLFFPRRDLNPHHCYTAAPFA